MISEVDNKIEIILDASQLEYIEACPRKWYYSYILNLIPNRSRPALDIGSYYHEVLDKYWTLALNGIKDSPTRIKTSLAFASKDSTCLKYHISDPVDRAFHRQRLVDYFMKYADEDELITPIAVEGGFSTLLYEDRNRRYILEGKIDLIAKGFPYGLFVMDHKTQSRKDDRWEFNHQVCNYLSYTGANYFLYNYIGLQDKLPPEGMRRTIYKPQPGMLAQWKKEVIRTFDEMAHYIIEYQMTDSREVEAYPRKRAACDSSKYGLCQYHKLCSVPDGSKWVPAVFSAYKEKKDPWKAWGIVGKEISLIDGPHKE